MNFGQAIEALKQFKHVKRAKWGGYWSMELATGFSTPVIVAHLKDSNDKVPATAYQEDMLAEDWQIVN